MPTTRAVLAAIAFAAIAAVPATATAATATYEGDVLVVRGAPGAADFITLGEADGPARVSVTEVTSYPPDRCTQVSSSHPVFCDAPGVVRIEGGDGADIIGFGTDVPATSRYEIVGGAGDDRLSGPRNRPARALLDGGDGSDELKGWEGDDTVLGGPGGDTIEGGAGTDELRGGPGDDVLTGDSAAEGSGAWPDVIDGGEGSDLLDDYRQEGSSDRRTLTLSLDGAANDGRPDEGDNIVAVEDFKVQMPVAAFVGDDAANAFTASEVAGPVQLDGRGGADRLSGGDGADVVLGGEGDDTLAGGFGDDRVVGGPGRDRIDADRPARCNDVHCDVTGGYGNDVVEAVDGAADQISCGPGTDRVLADAADTVATDCETVQRSGAGQGGPGEVQVPDGTKTPVPSLVVRDAVVRATTLRRAGARLRVSTPAAGTLSATGRSGRILVVRGAARTTRPGQSVVTLRLTAAGRRLLRRPGRRTVHVRVAFRPAAGGAAVTRTARLRVR